MRKAVWSSLFTAAAFLCVAAPAFAQATANGSISVNANINARARLTFGAASVTFADADPDTVPTLSSAAVTIDVRARTSQAGNVTLTVLATGDLLSGTDAIGINNLTWTVTGAGFVGGTANSTVAQTVGSWTGSGSPSGTQTFALPNSWAYNTGTYTTTLNYTLTVP